LQKKNSDEDEDSFIQFEYMENIHKARKLEEKNRKQQALNAIAQRGKRSRFHPYTKKIGKGNNSS
jgi:hypothetical protein